MLFKNILERLSAIDSVCWLTNALWSDLNTFLLYKITTVIGHKFSNFDRPLDIPMQVASI